MQLCKMLSGSKYFIWTNPMFESTFNRNNAENKNEYKWPNLHYKICEKTKIDLNEHRRGRRKSVIYINP